MYIFSVLQRLLLVRIPRSPWNRSTLPSQRHSRMIKAHKIRLHPTPEQANYFAHAAGTSRFVFNWALAEWKTQYEAGGKPSALALKKQFNAIRKEQFPLRTLKHIRV